MAVLGLVFAFLVPLLGAVFSAVGLKQTRERGEGGRGLAVAGLIVSIGAAIAWLLVAMFVFASGPGTNAGDIAASQAVGGGTADDGGVANACRVIVPAAADFAQHAGSTPEEVRAELGRLSTTLRGAAAGTTDAQFTAHVQQLADDVDALAAAVSQGQDPTSLEGALTDHAGTLDQDCAAVGVTGAAG